jgi:hypothetical protein
MFGGMFIEPDEIAERNRQIHILGCGEWVAPEFVLKTRDDDREAQGIQPRIHQGEIIVERRDLLFLLRRDLLEL